MRYQKMLSRRKMVRLTVRWDTLIERVLAVSAYAAGIAVESKMNAITNDYRFAKRMTS
jgi:hypothetical protein